MSRDRLLVGVSILLLGSAFLPKAPALRRPRAVAWLVLALITGDVAARWLVSGHPPVFGTFEMDLAEALVVLAMGMWLAEEAGEAYLRAVLAAAGVTLAHTFLLRAETTPLTISERSLWIDAHAALAWLAWGGYVHAALLAFREAALEGRALSLLGWAFLAHTAMGATGVYYATLLFATPWSWDPVQTLGLLSWLLCAAALHFRLFFGVSLHRQRHFLLLVLAAYILSAKLIMVLPAGQSFHVFELGAMAGEPR